MKIKRVNTRQLKRMIELHEKGLSLEEIGKIVKLAKTNVKYHLDNFELKKNEENNPRKI